MTDGKKTDVPGAPLDNSIPTETPKLLQQDLGRHPSRQVPSFEQLQHPPRPTVPSRPTRDPSQLTTDPDKPLPPSQPPARTPAAMQLPQTDPMKEPEVLAAIALSAAKAEVTRQAALPPRAMEPPRPLGPDLSTTDPGTRGVSSKARPPAARAPPSPQKPFRATGVLPGDEVTSDQVLARPASIWRRGLSWIIDLAAISSAVGALLALAVLVTGGEEGPVELHGLDAVIFRLQPIEIPALILTVLLAALYTTLGAFLFEGRTAGRLLLGIRLVDSSGHSPGVIRSLIRAVLAIFSVALFFSGFWLSLFNRRGQTLHDKLTRTFVVRPV